MCSSLAPSVTLPLFLQLCCQLQQTFGNKKLKFTFIRLSLQCKIIFVCQLTQISTLLYSLLYSTEHITKSFAFFILREVCLSLNWKQIQQLSGPELSISCDTAAPQNEHLITNVASEKQEEAKWKHFNVVLLIFWGCLNNYEDDVVSMAAITPDKRALPYQWGQQSVLCLHRGDNILTPNSVIQPSGFLSNGKDSQIKRSVFCMLVTMCHTGDLGSQSKANTGADGFIYFALTLFGGSCPFLIERPLAVCHAESLILTSLGLGVFSVFSQVSGPFFKVNSKR